MNTQEKYTIFLFLKQNKKMVYFIVDILDEQCYNVNIINKSE